MRQIKTNKIPLIILLLGLFVVLVSVSAVSAASTVYVNTTGDDTAGNGSAESPYLTIGKGISSVDENGSVNIADGNYSETGNTNLTISKSMTIAGQSQNRTIINGTGTNWIFNIASGVNVTICNLTITNGSNAGDVGGAIYNAGDLTISGCKFTNNTADYGGAILNDGSLTISGCHFSSNTATNDSLGGAICNGGNLNISDSTFTNNTARNNYGVGGAIYNYGSLILSSSTFIGNSARYGGAIDNEGDGLTISGSTFTGNTAQHEGGAIRNYDDSLNVTNSTFTGNSAQRGGAIWNSGGNCDIHFNRIVENTADQGSAIYRTGGTVNATLNWWGDNNSPAGKVSTGVTVGPWIVLTITADPTNIANGGNSQVTADLQHDNNGDLISGGHVPDGIPVTFGSTKGSVDPGSAVKVNGQATTTFTPSCYSGIATVNAAVDGFSLGTPINVTNAEIHVSTTGSDTTGDGSQANPYQTISTGVSMVSPGGNVHIANGTYTGTGNTGITIDKNLNIIGESQTGTIIDGASTAQIFKILSGLNVTICNLTLTNGNNTGGGAIENYGNLTVNNCIFTGNTAGWDGTNTNYGGAINNKGTLTVNNSKFNNNSARVGGAIYNSPDSTLNVNNSIFNNNTARLGGAIYNHGSSIVKGSTFTNNAAQRGGAIFNLNYDLLLNIDNCIFTDNNVTFGGGAIYNNAGNVTVTGSIFTSNSALDRGGAVYNEGVFNVISCTFTDNSAISGGAIYNWETLTLNNCNFTDNSANNGGGIYNNHGDANFLTVTGSNFRDNTASERGGAIYNADTISLSGSTFTNNTADDSGGAIFNDGILNSVTSTVMNCTFTGNRATFDGGAIASVYDNGSITSTLTGCSFIGNAAYLGGAVFNRGTLTANFNRFYNNAAEYGDAVSGDEFDSVDIEKNWWGSNNPDWGSLIDGLTNPGKWVILSVNATPNNINNTQTSTITADFNHINGGGDLIGGHIPDGPVTLDIPWGSFTKSGITHSITLNTVAGVIATTFYANEGAVNPLFNPVKVTATADGYTTNNTESAYININKTSDLYIKITSDKKNPKVGETFTLTYKLGNNGPDDAENVTITIPLPVGFVISKIDGDGSWTINGNTITWTLANVPVGDPYLYISGNVLRPGSYIFSSSISSETYNIDSQGVTPVTINAVNEVKAANKTIPLQKTGLPLAGLVLAFLAVCGGFVMPKRKS